MSSPYGLWSAYVIYEEGDVVIGSDQNQYQALIRSIGEDPLSYPNAWEKVGTVVVADNASTAVLSQPAAAWDTQNPVLSLYQVGVESDTGFYKTGDGTTTWKTLHYANSPGYVTFRISGSWELGNPPFNYLDVPIPAYNTGRYFQWTIGPYKFGATDDFRIEVAQIPAVPTGSLAFNNGVAMWDVLVSNADATQLLDTYAYGPLTSGGSLQIADTASSYFHTGTDLVAGLSGNGTEYEISSTAGGVYWISMNGYLAWLP